MVHWYILAHLVTFTLLFRTSSSIDCYQCSGTNNEDPFQCNEVLGRDIDLVPESCDSVYEAKYCIKHTGRFEGGIGTKRFCSSMDLGNYCNYVRQPGDTLTYRTCIHSCSENGCNLSAQLIPMTATTTAVVSLITALLTTLIHR
ncbi:hypothetical protein RN001_005465 [Aquatica leii]|uniref:Protein sleepless n=1 Tax=Aquatica leii TaxID=1421715 RepID=A0AAN7PGY7_9COLE|nr:hypothetical protein RN001_005465 [Aquatica leii]